MDIKTVQITFSSAKYQTYRAHSLNVTSSNRIDRCIHLFISFKWPLIDRWHGGTQHIGGDQRWLWSAAILVFARHSVPKIAMPYREHSLTVRLNRTVRIVLSLGQCIENRLYKLTAVYTGGRIHETHDSTSTETHFTFSGQFVAEFSYLFWERYRLSTSVHHLYCKLAPVTTSKHRTSYR